MESGIFAAGLTSLALGGAMAVFGWKAIRHDRRREVARTTLLSQLAFPGGVPGPAIADTSRLPDVDEFRSEPSVATETLFSEARPSGAASRRTAALTVIGVTCAIVIASYTWLGRGDTSVAAETSAPVDSGAITTGTTVSVPPPVQPAPRVELLSLGHRATPEAFVVTGQVRNPADGAPIDDIVAVVGVMDATGRLITTVRAPLKQRGLQAGALSEFSAAATKVTNVAQFRVEFQNSARGVIPHFDRRKQE